MVGGSAWWEARHVGPGGGGPGGARHVESEAPEEGDGASLPRYSGVLAKVAHPPGNTATALDINVRRGTRSPRHHHRTPLTARQAGSKEHPSDDSEESGDHGHAVCPFCYLRRSVALTSATVTNLPEPIPAGFVGGRKGTARELLPFNAAAQQLQPRHQERSAAGSG